MQKGVFWCAAVLTAATGAGCAESGSEDELGRDAGRPVIRATPRPHTVPATPGVRVTVTGPGRVTSIPAGIDCTETGGVCAASFPASQGTVHLAFDAAVTGRWSGACTGNGGCAIDLAAPVTVGATTFAPVVIPFVADGADGAAESVAIGADDTIVATGTVRHPFEAMNVWTRAFAADGAPLWSAERGSSEGSPDAGHAVAVTAAGDAVVAGRWYSHTDIRLGWLVFGVSAAGAVTWSQAGDTIIGDDEAVGVAVAPAGDLVVVGYRPGAAWWVRGMTPTGIETWSRTGDGTVASAVTTATDGTSFVAGRVVVAGQGSDALLAAYTRAGELAWTASHAGPKVNSEDAAVAVAANGGVVAMAGREAGRGWLGVYAEDGTLLWDAVTENVDSWSGVAVDALGGVVATADGLTRRYDAAGELQWSRDHGGTDVAFTTSGELVLASGRELIKLRQ